MRKLTILAMVLGLAMVVAPAASADSHARPFKGSAVGSVTFPHGTECENYGGLNVRTDGYGVGRASHMGRTIVMSSHCTPEGPTIAGHTTLVAANGDEVYLEYAGANVPPDPETGIIVSETEFVVTGGTGRFEDAQGGGTFIAYVVFEGIEDPEWPVGFVWRGTIGY